MKLRNKLFLVALVVVLLTSSFVFAEGGVTAVISDIKLFLNGERVDKEIIIIDGSSYLPVRAISEALDLEVVWNGATSTIELNSQVDDSAVLMKEMLDLANSNNDKLKSENALLEEENVAVKSENDLLKELLVKNNIKLPVNYEIEKYIGQDDDQIAFATVHNSAYIGNMMDLTNQLHFGGISLSDEKYDTAYVTLGLQGQYDKFLGTMLVDAYSFRYSDSQTGYLHFYGDDELIKTIEVSKDLLPTDIEVDVAGVAVLKIEYRVPDVYSYKSANMGITKARLVAEETK